MDIILGADPMVSTSTLDLLIQLCLCHRCNVTFTKRLAPRPTAIPKRLLAVNANSLLAPLAPAAVGACPPDLAPSRRAGSRAERCRAEPLLRVTIQGQAAAADKPIGCLVVVLLRAGTCQGGHAHVVRGTGLAPDIALPAGVWAEGSAAGLHAGGGGGVVLPGLGADVRGYADVVAGEGFAPDVACGGGMSLAERSKFAGSGSLYEPCKHVSRPKSHAAKARNGRSRAPKARETRVERTIFRLVCSILLGIQGPRGASKEEV